MLFAPPPPAGGCASGECLPSPDDDARPLGERWHQAVEAVRRASPRHGLSLAHGRLRSITGDGTAEVWIAFPRTAAFHEATVTGAGRAKVEAALSAYLRKPARLRVDNAVEGLEPSPAEREARQKDDRERDVEQALRGHPAVSATLRILGGELEHIQVLDPDPT